MFRKIRRFLGLKPPHYNTRQKLHAAIKSGQFAETDPYEENIPKMNKIAGWDSWFDGGDWVELAMWGEDLGMELNTVGDFVKLLETIDSQYES